jgi:hypothetical protein
VLARPAAVAALSFVAALVLLGGPPACAGSDPLDLSQVSPDAGPPVGFAECAAVYFGDYQKACSDFSDCHGLLQCDLTRTFSQTARCHAKLCELASECVDAYKNLCLGDDFHFDCIRANPVDPTECRVVEGPAP